MHVLQAAPNYCVPACIVMAERWRGETHEDPVVRQHELFERLAFTGQRFLPLELAAVALDVPSVESFSIEEPEQVALLSHQLRSNGCAAVLTCWSERFATLLRERSLVSPYGASFLEVPDTTQSSSLGDQTEPSRCSTHGPLAMVSPCG